MSEYMPTTKTVEAYYCHAWQDITGSPTGDHSSHEEFGRWLNSVKAEAWDTGHEAFEEAWRSDHLFPYDYAAENPYRTGGAE